MWKEIRVFSPNVVITLYFLNLKMCVPECRLSFFQPPKFFVLTNSVFGFTNLLQRHCLLFLWSCHVVIFLMSHANDVCFLPQYFVQEVGRWVSRFLRRHVWNLPALPYPLFLISSHEMSWVLCTWMQVSFSPLLHPSERGWPKSSNSAEKKEWTFVRFMSLCWCVVFWVLCVLRFLHVNFWIRRFRYECVSNFRFMARLRTTYDG